MTNKDKYKNFCIDKVPVYSQYWWLDALCGEENWDVILIEKNNQIIASLPYEIQKKENGKIQLGQPILTQSLGPYIIYPKNMKYSNKLSYEKKIMNELIYNLPEHDKYAQNFYYTITNWLPFYWKGFSQTTRYTYIINDLSNLDNIWNEFSSNTKNEINKVKNKVNIVYDLDPQLFYDINSITFNKQNVSMPYSFEVFDCLLKASQKNNCGKTFFAIDSQKNIHGVLFLVWDNFSSYYLMGGAGNTPYKQVSKYLIWKAIQFSSKFVNKFDFEGSMKENIEVVFRKFGAVQTPYFHIERKKL